MAVKKVKRRIRKPPREETKEPPDDPTLRPDWHETLQSVQTDGSWFGSLFGAHEPPDDVRGGISDSSSDSELFSDASGDPRPGKPGISGLFGVQSAF